MLRFPQFSKCSASSEDQTGAAGGETLNISRIHFDDLAAAKAAHLNAKLKGQTVEGVATPKKALKRPELRKVMVEFADGSSEVKVPYAQLSLSNGDTITRYIVDFDTDSTAERAKAREAWIAARGSEPKTQLEYARAGIITPEM